MPALKRFLAKHGWWPLPLYFALVYLLPLNSRLLWIPDEARYAEISREMVRSGDWIVPKLLGLRYFEKPVAGYWLNSLSQLLFGETRFAVRFASAFTAGLSALLVFWLASRLFRDRRKAIAAALCYLSGLLVFGVGTYSVLDSMVTLWLNLALVAFYVALESENFRGKLAGYGLAGVAAGLGFLTKGFISLAVPFIVVVPYLIYRKRLGELRHLWISLLGALVVSLPWAIAVHLREPGYWHYFFWVEHIQRFAAKNAQHKAPVWYYLPCLLIGCLPWLGAAPAALRRGWRSLQERPAIVFLVCWLLIPLAFFSIAKGKLPTYILPCFAPLAILLGHGLIELIGQRELRPFRLNGWLNLAFGALATVAILLVGTGKLGKHPLYSASEHGALVAAAIGFLAWALAGWVCLRRPDRTWWVPALCPLVLGLLVGFALPSSSIHSKMPEPFIAEHRQLLAHSPFVLSNDVGVAATLGWALKRDDIRLFGSQGELAYGLKTSPVPDKFVGAGDFPAWLSRARRAGDVALLTRNERGKLPDLPKADQVLVRERLSLFLYRKQP